MVTLNDKQEIIISYLKENLSQREIYRKTGIARDTIRKYVREYENSHEAIIPRDLYMQVQEEMLRRTNLHSGADRKKRVYSSKYALSSIVYCPKCGDIYRRIAWNNRGKRSFVWRCVTRVEHGPERCGRECGTRRLETTNC